MRETSLQSEEQRRHWAAVRNLKWFRLTGREDGRESSQPGGSRAGAARGAPPHEAPPSRSPAPPASGQWEPGMLAGGRCGRVATAGAGRWRRQQRRWQLLRALPEESRGIRGGGAMEGLEGEEVKEYGPGG